MLHETLSFQPAPNFEKRQLAQREFEQKQEYEGQFTYNYYRGDYNKSVEKFIENTVRELMKVKKEPIILMDIGGGIGASWLRLADVFKKDIQNSKLALVVSNFKYDPETIISLKKLSTKERDERRAAALAARLDANAYLVGYITLVDIEKKLSKNRPLINYITGSFSDLPAKNITLPNKKIVSLSNNVDIIHEAWSLTAWSLTPEVDILNILKLTSPYTIYLIPKRDTLRPQNNLDAEYDNVREGVKIIHQAFQQQFGYIMSETEDVNVDIDRDSKAYLIFSQPKSPFLIVNK